jgi:hypothetical protein
VNAFTLTTSTILFPASSGPVIAGTSFVDSSWMAIGQVLIITDPNGTDWGSFRVLTLPNGTSATLQWLDYSGDAPGTTTTLAIGAKVSPSGVEPVLAAPLPTAFTDNSGGTPSDTIAAGAGEYIHSIYFRAAAITGNVLLYTYTPGFNFKIKRISASVVDAITTGAKAATLTTSIGGTPTTGGVVVMAGAYALGAEQASSAVISGANIGTTVQAITINASSVTAFIEGGFMLNLEIQNLDSANAIASLADHVNDLITSLT